MSALTLESQTVTVNFCDEETGQLLQSAEIPKILWDALERDAEVRGISAEQNLRRCLLGTSESILTKEEA